MAGGRRGLVAPQNTFLENIVRRSNGKDENGCGALNRKISAVKQLIDYFFFNGDWCEKSLMCIKDFVF